MPFEWLASSVQNLSSAVRTARAIRSRKFISRSNICWRNSNKTRQDFKTVRQALLNDACRHVYITQTVITLLFFVYLRLMTLSSFFTGKRSIHKLLLNPKPYGPYVFVAALEDTRFCLAKEINFKINNAHNINVTLYSLRALRFTMRFV